MVMQRRHLEDAPPFAEAFFRVLEVGHLHHHGKRFRDEHAAHDEQHDFLPHDHGDGPKRATERKRADIAHEDLRGVRVVPEKCESRATHCRTKNK